jgi:hypothetical protein
MRLFELQLEEEPVLSSWISDITLQRNGRDATMSLGNGRRYSVLGLGPQLYAAWIAAPSKGKFWHAQVKQKFQVKRIM